MLRPWFFWPPTCVRPVAAGTTPCCGWRRRRGRRASISRGAAISSCTRAWPGPPCAWASGSRRWRCRSPERPLPAGRRLPRLSAHARDEREAAIALATRGLEAAATVAARFAVLDFGEVTLATRPGELDRAFARREMDEDEPGSLLLAAAVAERRARGDELGDACRWSLERLVRGAERAGLTLALPVAATPWQVPSPREARELAEAFTGAPVGLVWDPGRLSVLAALGLAISDERLRALAGAAVLALDNDAVGIRAGFLPGLGERDARVAALAPGASAPHIVTGGPVASDAEVAAAVRAGARRIGKNPGKF